ncbi:hypothetical protein [Prochlorothrix hollandica]|uniref:hypothetical protein n=1 Tax=Prochlorothrix hollandica TaxID=1223 RepID=UPI000345AEA5|nr:hypothetical protein [Prochlorothrix hollandica]
MGFFANCKTVEEGKALYKNLARQYHPDLGGDLETMKTLNHEYDLFLKKMDGSKSQGTDGKTHAYKYDQELEQELMDVIMALLGLKMADVDITLIGLWVWITGNTKPHRQDLKDLKCRWNSTRKAWYYRPDSLAYRPSSNADLEELAAKYGSADCTHFRKNPAPRRQSKKQAIAS